MGNKAKDKSEDTSNVDVSVEDSAPELTPEQVAVRVAFSSAVDSGAEGDAVKLAMIQAGAKFSNVTRQYNELMELNGLVTPKADIEQAVANACAEVDLSDEDTLGQVVEEIEDAISEIGEKRALQLVKAWAKKNNQDVFAKPRGEGRRGFRFKLYEWMKQNPTSTDDEMKAYLTVENGASPNDVNHMSHYIGIMGLVRDIATQD